MPALGIRSASLAQGKVSGRTGTRVDHQATIVIACEPDRDIGISNFAHVSRLRERTGVDMVVHGLIVDPKGEFDNDVPNIRTG